MTTLYKDKKSSIIRALVEYTFAKETELLQKQEESIFTRVYALVIPAKHRTLLASLPEGFVPTTNYFYVNAGGYRLEIKTKGEEVRIPNNLNHWDGVNLTDPDFIQELQVFSHAKEKLSEKKNQFRYTVSSTIYSFRTKEKFIEAFPNWIDFLGKDFFGVHVSISKSLTITPQEIMCQVANIRGEEKEGCCDGDVIT